MSTVVGVETDSGVALAADRASVTHGTVGGSVDRVFEFEGAGAAAVGEPGAVASFGRRLRRELDEERIERDRAVGVDRLARVAARIAETEDVDAVVTARDDDGAARLRSVDSGGAVLEGRVAAFGTGAEAALGHLDETAPDDDRGGLEERVEAVLTAVAERDPETGVEIDAWSLESEP